MTRPGRPNRDPARLVEDVEWIIGTDTADNIAHRLGYAGRENLARVLQRIGRHDLARRIEDPVRA